MGEKRFERAELHVAFAGALRRKAARSAHEFQQIIDAAFAAFALFLLEVLDEPAHLDDVIDLVVHDVAARRVRVIDWKTNRPRAGEDAGALLQRLGEDYRPQLEAYGACMAGFFPDCTVSLELYASAVGAVRVLPPT
jgi:ATP-dependent exoDNAse (exonuclease V) beta subunit